MVERTRGNRIAVSLTDEEEELLNNAARVAGVPPSTFVRNVVLRAVQGDRDRRLLSLILAEILRLQKRVEPKLFRYRDNTVYGILHGVEDELDELLDQVGAVSQEQLEAITDVLNRYDQDPELLRKFKGFYDIEHELQRRGVDRGTAMIAIRYLFADGRFTEVIQKMDSSHSPIECRHFELDEWDT